jgi:hypothetical protein
MAIIKLSPTSKIARRDEQIFSRLIGECITRWAFIDRALFEYCNYCLGGRWPITAIVFYRTPQLKQRLDLVDELLRKTIFFIKVRIPSRSRVAQQRCDTMLREWAIINKKLNGLIEVRNVIAHQPMMRAGTTKKHGKGDRAHYYFAIQTEMRASYRSGRKHWVLKVEDLRSHFRKTEAMIRVLRGFLSRLERLEKRRSTGLFR